MGTPSHALTALIPLSGYKPIWTRYRQQVASEMTGWLNLVLSHVPLVLMTVLAIASFAILKQAPGAKTDVLALLNNQNDDHYLKQFLTTSYSPQGNTRLVLSAESAHHNPAKKEMRLSELSFAATSQATQTHYTGSAKQGVIVDGAKRFSLSEQVVINKQTSGANGGDAWVRFQGEYIVFTVDPDTVTSNVPIHIQSAKNNFTAGSLYYDNATKQMQMKGRVRMVMERR